MNSVSQSSPTVQRGSGTVALTVLDPSTDDVVIINTYAVAPGRAEELLDALVTATQETLRFVPGFVSANFHVSLDGASVVNYAQWRDADAIKAAGADPEVAARIQRVGQITQSFTPVLYKLRRSVSAASKSTGEVA